VIQDLQNELGVKLFERLGNKRQLTEEGKRVLQRAEAVLANTEAIKEDLDELRGLKKGRISVGSSGIGTSLILPAIQEFKEEFPGLVLTLTIQKSDILQKKLLDGDLDVAILGLALQSPLIISEPYREEELVFIAPPKHPLAKKSATPLKLLAQEPLITFENDSFSPIIARTFAERGLSFKPLLKINLEMGSREAIKSAVASGLGISFLTKCHVLSDVKAGRISILKVPEFTLKRTMYLAVHRNRHHAPFVQEFITFLKQYGGKKVKVSS
jgi:DNA-binding transcriptional LysR family regulator